MSIVFFGDVHCQEKEPHRTASLQFLDWLYENYGNEVVISGGDLFHQSSHNHTLVDAVVERLVKFKDFRIILGNHETSRRQNSILKPLRHHKNITVYETIAEFDINDISFIALPSDAHNEKRYEDIQGKWDYSLNHFEPIQESFDKQSGTELKFKVNVAHIFAHIHRYSEFIDNFKNKVLISGSILDTRYGEQEWEKNIYILSKTGYEKIKVPQMFTYQTIKYGEFPENKNNILNIIEAPSFVSVYEMYKDYHVRKEGIEVLRTENDDAQADVEFESGNIVEKFKHYSVDKKISKEVNDCANKYLQEVV